MTKTTKPDPYDTLVPEGQYRLGYVGFERGIVYGRPVFFVTFLITDLGKFHGLPVFRFYNVPSGRTPRSSNLGLDFMAIVGRRPPASLTPVDFLKGVEVLGEIVTVREQISGRRRIERPEDCHYSKVSRLIRLTAGSPPCAPASRTDLRGSSSS